jgi:ribosomal protein L11 methyltransferase
LYPALDVVGPDAEFLLAAVDECSPLALEEHGTILTLYFSTATDRERARGAILRQFPDANATSREVDDGDWARRSQQNLQPVTVGRVTIAPPWAAPNLQPVTSDPQPPTSNLQPLFVIIEPSMGFGTGHHATTRLCLAALQTLDLTGAFVLDVGTGSGVLAMAARRFGAREVVGIDTDPDAIRSAVESLQLNPDLDHVNFELGDLTAWPASPRGREPADVVTANLTGALLVRGGNVLIDSVRPGGHLIISGAMRTQEREVVAVFEKRARIVSITSEDEWVGLVLRRAGRTLFDAGRTL